MKLLAFETATPSGGVALLVDGRVLGEMRFSGSQSHSRHCLEMAEFLLRTGGLKWSQLDGLATSYGPGAFTGVRVGLTLVKGLAWSLGLGTVAVNTLEAMALGAWGGEPVDAVVPLIDARMGEVYTAAFRPQNGRMVRLTEDRVIPPAEAAAAVPGRVLLCGEGELAYRDAFAEPRFERARADRLLASPGAVAVLAAETVAAHGWSDPASLAAIYLREAVQPRATG